MTITLKALRQEVIAAVIPFDYTQMVSGVYQAAAEIPANSMVTSVRLVTAFNSATSDTFSVGDKVGSAAAAPTTFTAAAAVPVGTPQFGQSVGKLMTSVGSVGITWTGVGAAPTAGNGLLIVEYVGKNRGQFAQGLG
jgi:hypothetical protein